VHGVGVDIRAADNIVQRDSVRSGLCNVISKDVVSAMSSPKMKRF
jgi:hypothetical protein